jgi:hypothetical protein
MAHNLVVNERLNNFAQYRWEVTCSCGWQGRGPTKSVAESLGTSHGGTLPEEKKEEKPKVVATTGGTTPASGGSVAKPVTPATPVVPPKPVIPPPKP